MNASRVLNLTVICLTVLSGACARSSPLTPDPTSSDMPAVQFNVTFDGPAPGSVVAQGTPFSITNNTCRCWGPR